MELFATYSLQLRHLSADLYALLNRMTYHSARLYNVALYIVKNHYEETQMHLNYNSFYHNCKEAINYKVLPSTVAQQTLKILDRNYRSFFSVVKKAKKSKDLQFPEPPHFLPKKSKFVIVFTKGTGFQIKDGKLLLAVSNYLKKDQQIQRIELDFPTNIDPSTVQEIRILPKCNGKFFTLQIIYKDKEVKHDLDRNKVLGGDLGLSNLITCVDIANGKAFIMDGKWIKSINRFYNKQLSKLQSIKDKQKIKGTTERMYRITRKRANRIRDIMHKTAKYITDYCLENNIGTIVVGHNKEWKQEINLGKKSNQNFVQVPFGRLMEYLKYRCDRYGIEYHEVGESHTSKCSFLDYEEIKHHDEYVGKRVKRGLFKTSKGVLVNADCNGAANIGARAIGLRDGSKQVAKVTAIAREQLEACLKTPSRIRIYSNGY
jgi:putative transposase